MEKGRKGLAAVLLAGSIFLSGCGSQNVIEDFATNEGYDVPAAAGADSDESSAASGGGVKSGDGMAADGKDAGTEEVKGIPKEKIKVGVIHLSDPAAGSGYTYTHDLGIQGMQTNLGLTNEQIVRKINVDDTDTEAVEAALQECVDEGCNIIFSTSWGYMEATAQMAEKYPDVYFSHGTGYMSNGKNFNNYFGRIYQARYLSGLVAGMNTKTNMIGYVAAQGADNAEVTGGIDAFAIGVAEVNPEAVIYVKVTNSWFDPEAEEEASHTLLDMGCDVMAQHCDTPYPQTLAQERGVYGIGYNSDMSKETPDSCLCSVVWNWSAYYTAAVQSLIDGSWDGSNYYGGYVDGLVAVTEPALFCTEGTKEKVEEAKAKIVSGEMNVFDGVLETNTGETVGEEGKTLEDAVITGGINWYYKNVEVLE